MEYKQKQKFYYDQTAKPRPQCGAEDSIRIQTPDGWKPATYVSTSLHSRHGRENPMILEKKRLQFGYTHAQETCQNSSIIEEFSMSCFHLPWSNHACSEGK